MNSDDDLSFFSKSSPEAPSNVARVTKVIAVSELNRRTRNLLEANLELLWVSGELSNVMRAASGHWYFSLKDEAAQVRCVMFRQRASSISFTPENGLQVEVRALPSLYEPRGEFQLGVETMRRAGLGALFEAYERLKARLAAAGMFDEKRKKQLPAFPRTIGIITSPQAAALHDVLKTLERRAPMIRVIIYPTLVQGANAASEITAAIDKVRQRDEIDVLIICRGGGSIEDLWSFNEETVSRAILRLQNDTLIAVVSGVGHETDFTICDFVADQRAPTPTAAAELVSPDTAQLRIQVALARLQLTRTMRRHIDTLQQQLDHAARGLLSPHERLARALDRVALAAAQIRHAMSIQRDRVENKIRFNRQRLINVKLDITGYQVPLIRCREKLKMALRHQTQQRLNQLESIGRNLSLLSPILVLERGYSIVERRGLILRNAQDVEAGDALSVRLAKGRIAVEVIAITNDRRPDSNGKPE